MLQSKSLTADAAIALLPPDETVHTILFAGPIAMGCDMPRETLTAAIEASPDRAYLDDHHAPRGDHHLRISYRGAPLYILTEARQP